MMESQWWEKVVIFVKSRKKIETLKCVLLMSQMQSGQKLLVKVISKSDASIQTEIHPLETNIVKSHEWNEWELRRKAIKLVRTQPHTHTHTISAQTDRQK